MIEFHDPRAAPGTPVDAYELAIDLTVPVGSEPVTVGLLANGFPDSVAFLDQVQRACTDLVPHVRFARYDKGNASAVVSDEMLGEIVAECRAVVAAYGH